MAFFLGCENLRISPIFLQGGSGSRLQGLQVLGRATGPFQNSWIGNWSTGSSPCHWSWLQLLMVACWLRQIWVIGFWNALVCLQFRHSCTKTTRWKRRVWKFRWPKVFGHHNRIPRNCSYKWKYSMHKYGFVWVCLFIGTNLNKWSPSLIIIKIAMWCHLWVKHGKTSFWAKPYYNVFSTKHSSRPSPNHQAPHCTCLHLRFHWRHRIEPRPKSGKIWLTGTTRVPNHGCILLIFLQHTTLNVTDIWYQQNSANISSET